MKTLRLLIWLRWRIGINTTTTRGRWAAIGITTLFALAMAPIYVGGAIGSFALGMRVGPPALPIVFGLCQLGVLWVSLLVSGVATAVVCIGVAAMLRRAGEAAEPPAVAPAVDAEA